jgi:chemotaxis protein methyltransferase CheR
VGREFLLDDSVKGAVAFRSHNLVVDSAEVFPEGSYDVVFCRNVIMYFSPEVARSVVARIARSLAPGGYLFLGHAETLRGLSTDFHLRHTHGTFYYQRRQGALRHAGPCVRAPEVAPSPLGAIVPTWSTTWIETVRAAAARIEALSGSPLQHEAALEPAVVAGVPARPDVALALELLAQERYSDALDHLGQLPQESTSAPDFLLLRAVLLTHGGQLEAAERTCEELLGRDDLSAGAHYVLALCREGAGDPKGAMERDRVASYLDPGFSMPHLHLALMARRQGDHEVAQKEFGQALALLLREDASRLLLFGGGFSREGLMALCSAQLAASRPA